MHHRPVPADEPATDLLTFFFSDIEGSTRLAQQLGTGWEEVLDRHRSIVREAFRRRGGREVGTEGDSFFAVFRDPADAVAVAIEVQRGLAKAAGPAVRVRIGLHAGPAALRDGDLVGVEIHRAARIAAGGHGGQVLVSDAVRGLVADRLPEGAGLRNLGEFRLRDFDSPQTIFQLTAPGLDDAFASLTLAHLRLSNLPTALSSFVGRHAERADLATAVRESRLVTVLGPGGTGKTRLAIEVADGLLPEMAHGVWFADLSPLTDPALVLPTAAAALQVRVDPARQVMDEIADQLADRVVLLVLDNFEQLMEAAATVAELLARLPLLRVLVTSREPMHVSGEREFHLRPMHVATEGDIDRVARTDAVALFVERARAADGSFELTAENAITVAEIVRRLDGLPLAIELAAARVKILAPDELLARLEHGQAALATGLRDVPERQRTVESTIAWSYRLLDPADAALFARLAVFAGGAAVDMIEAVADPDGELGRDTLDGLASLVDKSLVVRTANRFGSRFRQLETIRAYALARLTEADPDGAVMQRHADAMLALAEAAQPGLTAAGHEDRLERMVAEIDNFRAALTWALATDSAALAARLSYALWRFWQVREHLAEGERWFRQVLDLPGMAHGSRESVIARIGLGNMLYWIPRLDEAIAQYAEAAAAARAMGDDVLLAEAVSALAFAQNAAGLSSDAAGAEALALYDRLGDTAGAARTMLTMGGSDAAAENRPAARVKIEEALRRFEAMGDAFWIGTALATSAVLDLFDGDVDRGEERYRRALLIFAGLGDAASMYYSIYGLGWAAALRGDGVRAARLAGAAARLSEARGGTTPFITELPDPAVLAAGLIGNERARAEGSAGRQMSHDDLIAYAKQDD
jgi:predicted ATPase/class 3 adenylate cyclase